MPQVEKKNMFKDTLKSEFNQYNLLSTLFFTKQKV